MYTVEITRERRMRCALQSTNRRGHFAGDNVQNTLPDLTAIQLHESLLRDIKPRPGSIDSDKIDRRARRRVGQAPARAAVGRVPDHIERAADERELWNVAERREARDEAVRAVGARDVVERAALVVERRVVCGAQGHRC